MLAALAAMIPTRKQLATHKIALMQAALLLPNALILFDSNTALALLRRHRQRRKRAAQSVTPMVPARAQRLAGPVAQNLLFLRAGSRFEQHVVARHALGSRAAPTRADDLDRAGRAWARVAARRACVRARGVRFGARRRACRDGVGTRGARGKRVLRTVGGGVGGDSVLAAGAVSYVGRGAGADGGLRRWWVTRFLAAMDAAIEEPTQHQSP